jgi:signal transduction histidine kinase
VDGHAASSRARRVSGRYRRAITAAARRISAASLGERLALSGPDDELRELGDTFDELLARLEASFRAQRQFIASASHELRTPLARQRVISQVALGDPGATVESLSTAHERVLAAGAEQEQLIDALLTLARGQAGPSATLTGRLVDNTEASRSAAVTEQLRAAGWSASGGRVELAACGERSRRRTGAFPSPDRSVAPWRSVYPDFRGPSLHQGTRLHGNAENAPARRPP